MPLRRWKGWRAPPPSPLALLLLCTLQFINHANAIPTFDTAWNLPPWNTTGFVWNMASQSIFSTADLRENDYRRPLAGLVVARRGAVFNQTISNYRYTFAATNPTGGGSARWYRFWYNDWVPTVLIHRGEWNESDSILYNNLTVRVTDPWDNLYLDVPIRGYLPPPHKPARYPISTPLTAPLAQQTARTVGSWFVDTYPPQQFSYNKSSYAGKSQVLSVEVGSSGQPAARQAANGNNASLASNAYNVQGRRYQVLESIPYNDSVVFTASLFVPGDWISTYPSSSACTTAHPSNPPGCSRKAEFSIDLAYDTGSTINAPVLTLRAGFDNSNPSNANTGVAPFFYLVADGPATLLSAWNDSSIQSRMPSNDQIIWGWSQYVNVTPTMTSFRSNDWNTFTITLRRFEWDPMSNGARNCTETVVVEWLLNGYKYFSALASVYGNTTITSNFCNKYPIGQGATPTPAYVNLVRDIALTSYNFPQSTDVVNYTTLWSEVNIYRGADFSGLSQPGINPPTGSMALELVDVSGANGATAPLAKCFSNMIVTLDASSTLSVSSVSGGTSVYIPSLWTSDGDVATTGTTLSYKSCPKFASLTFSGASEAHLAQLLGKALYINSTAPRVRPIDFNSGTLVISNGGGDSGDEFGLWKLTYKAKSVNASASASGIFAIGTPPCTSGPQCSATTTCGAGRYAVANQGGNGYFCSLCPSGSYKLSSGSGTCTLCTAGTAKAEVGSGTCSSVCGAGYGSAQGFSDCIRCTVGSYSTVTAPTCTPCPAPWVSLVRGASQCLKCVNGRVNTCDGSVGSPCTDTSAGTPGDFTAVLSTIDLASAAIPSLWTSNFSYPTLFNTCTASNNTLLSFSVDGNCVVQIQALGVSTTTPGGTQCSDPDNDPATITAYYKDATTMVADKTGATSTDDGTIIKFAKNASAPTGDRLTLTLVSASVSPFTVLPTTIARDVIVNGGKVAGAVSTTDTCPAGSYVDAGGTAATTLSCSPCPTGSTCPTGTTVNTIQDCDAGTVNPILGGSCSACPQSTYAPDPGMEACLACSNNVLNDAGVGVTTAGTQCIPDCGADKVWDSDVVACVCSPGYGYDAGITACTACGANYYSSGGTEPCTPCPSGNTSPSMSSSCTRCPPGQALVGGSCQRCGPGQQPDPTGASCTACSPGFYNDGSDTACSRCGNGKKVVRHPTSGLNIGCTLCAAGEFSTWTPDYSDRVPALSSNGDATCQQCASGTYTSLSGQTSCKSCAGGQYTAVSTGAMGCSKCAAGSYRAPFSDNVCTQCPPGSDTAGASGASQCRLCPAGQFASTAGTKTCSPCPVNTYSTTGALACVSCPAGMDSYGEIGSDMCGKCDPGSANPTQGASCADCPVGTYQDKYGQKICRKCSIGMYSNDIGATACQTCDAGTYSPRLGSRSCRTCPAGTYSKAGRGSCAMCGVGKYSDPGSTGCTACPPGSYATDKGSGSCTACPSGSMCSDPTAAPQLCDPGSYQSKTGQTFCKLCPRKTYAPTAGSTSCLPCAGNTAAGQSTCAS